MKPLLFITTVLILLFTIACSPAAPAEQAKQPQPAQGKLIAESKSGNIKLVMTNPTGKLKEGDNTLTIEFQDQQGKPVDIGTGTVWLEMPHMGAMSAMRANAKLLTTQTPGVYDASVRLDMAGTWNLHAKYKGPAGEGQIDLEINCS